MDPAGYCPSLLFDAGFSNPFDWIDARALAGSAGGQLWWVVVAAPLLVAGGLALLATRRPVDPLTPGRDRAGTLRAVAGWAAGGVLVIAGPLVALHAWRERVAWQGETWRKPDPLVAGTHAVWELVVGRIDPRVATVLTVVLLHVLLATFLWSPTARRRRAGR